MRTSRISRRIDKLTATIRPNALREFTLEELSRYYWRMDKRGFKAFAKQAPMFRFFVGQFEREDAERARRPRAGS